MAHTQFTKIPTGTVSISCRGSITQSVIQRIIPTGERFTLRDTGQPGLILRVGASGTLSWAFDYRDRNNKRQTYNLGPVARYSPRDARNEVRRLAGSDPANDKRQRKLLIETAKDSLEAAKKRTLRKYLDGKYSREILSRAKAGEGAKKMIVSAFGRLLDTDMELLTVDSMMNIVIELRNQGLKPQSINRYRTALMALLNCAVKHKVIHKNPLLPWDKEPVENDRRVRWLGQNDGIENVLGSSGSVIGERERFHRALKNQPRYIQVMIQLALNTGMRRGEIFQLTWGSVDTSNRHVTIKAATSKASKTRHIALNSFVSSLLDVWRTESDTLFSHESLVFPSPYAAHKRRKPKQIKDIKHTWANLVNEAQLADFRFHDLRHDFASRLVQGGVSLAQVKELLGHSTVLLTERYSHLAPRQLSDAVEMLV